MTDFIVKLNLISFYYLLEIIKLRKINVDYKYDINKTNSSIKQYNKLLKKHKKYFNEYKDEEAETFKAKLTIQNPSFNIDSIDKLAKSFNVKPEVLYQLSTKQLLNLIKISIINKYKKSLEKKTDTIVKSEKINLPKNK